MPRPPGLSAIPPALRDSLFTRLAHRLHGHRGELFPLHVGDTWLEPPEGCRTEDLRAADHPGLHRYALPHGHPELLAALEEVRGHPRERVLVTAGATGALSAVAHATLEPGDEVLLLAPYWPLIPGVVRAARGVPVDVPFYDRPGSVEERLAPHVTERTVAIYVNTPNNPTGRVLREAEVRELADFARQRGLWLWSDEVYEEYAWGAPHRSPAAAAPERSFSVHSFSKAYGLAGNRCGWVLGPDADTMRAVRKLAVHQWYSAPTVAQLAGARALRTGGPWLGRARRLYRETGEAAAAALGLPAPEGGTFLFVDVARHLDDRGMLGFLEDCLDAGLLVAPGESCGADYAGFVRLCFTSAPPDAVARGVAALARRLGRG